MGKLAAAISSFGRAAVTACLLVYLLGFSLIAGILWYLESVTTQQQFVPEANSIADKNFHLSDSMVPGIYSYLSQQSDHEVTQSEVIGALSSHHLLARDLITDVIKQSCQKTEERTVVIVSPDHFHALRSFQPRPYGLISDFSWQTPQRLVAGDSQLSKLLARDAGLALVTNPTIIGHEHGVFALIPFLDRWCPNTKLIAIILSPSETNNALSLGRQLSQISLDSKTKPLVIVSSDFVHEKQLSEALQFDQSNQKILELIGDKNTNPDFDQVVSDCPTCLALLHGYLVASDSSKTLHIQHQSSADYGGSKQSVTTYFGAIWQSLP